MKNAAYAMMIGLLLGGCAAGNQYDYESANMTLPVRGAGAVGLLVSDQRPYVLSGDKPPSFIGLQRGGFGNPFSVTTGSGKPLASEMQSALERALTRSGFKVTRLSSNASAPSLLEKAVRDAGIDRNVVLTLNDWKSDVMMSFALTYDVVLQVLDANNSELARSTAQGNKEVMGGGSFESQNEISALRAFEAKMTVLFNSEEIRQVLETAEP